MTTFSKQFRDNYNDYLIYLQEGGKAPEVIEDWRYRDGLVHASDLYDCPLKAAKSRNNEPMVIPALAKRANPSMMHRLELGKRSAAPLQESILWNVKDSGRRWQHTAVENVIIHKELPLQGRYDGFITGFEADEFGFRQHMIELKHRLPTYKDKFPQPRISDVFQLLAYISIVGSDKGKEIDGYLGIINTPQYREFTDPMAALGVWHLRPEGDGFVLTDEEGNFWNHGMNDPSVINEANLKEEVYRQLAYLQGNANSTPIDLKDRDHAWQCCKVTKYPKNGGTGVIVPMCEHWCHTPIDDVTEQGILVNADYEVVYSF